ncbi:MAG: TolC family protein [Saprospiraceae bacterium]|nr:TolC family protein [Saprospiraceae bacterium]
MNRYLIFFLVGLLWSAEMRAQDSTFTMDQAIAYARENHNSIKGATMDIADAEHRIKEFLAIGLPNVNGSVKLDHFLQLPTSVIPKGSFFAGNPEQGEEPNPAQDLEVQFGVKNTLTAQLEASALLFDGSFFTGLKATRFYKELVKSQLDATREGLALDVAKAYLGVLVAERNREILDQNISNVSAILHETQEIYNSGFAEKLDVDRLQLSLANLQVEDEKIQNLVRISKNLLKFSMGYPMAQDIALTQNLQDLMLSDYDKNSLLMSELDFAQRADYVALQKADQLNELNIKRWKMGYYPSIYAFGSYGQTLQGNQFLTGNWFPASIVGLNLSLPIFDGNDKKAKIQRATISMEKHRLVINDAERAMTLEVRNAKINFENSLKNTETTQDNLDLAEDIYEVTQVKYREGVGSSLEVNQAERELYLAQSNYINTLYDLLVARVELEKALGNL